MNEWKIIIFTTISVSIFAKNGKDFENLDKKVTDKCAAPIANELKEHRGSTNESLHARD